MDHGCVKKTVLGLYGDLGKRKRKRLDDALDQQPEILQAWKRRLTALTDLHRGETLRVIKDQKSQDRAAKKKQQLKDWYTVMELCPKLGVLSDDALVVRYKQRGDLQDYTMSHYYYCARSEIEDELPHDYSFKLTMTRDGVDVFYAHLGASQDIDVGSDKVMFTEPTSELVVNDFDTAYFDPLGITKGDLVTLTKKLIRQEWGGDSTSLECIL